MAMTPNKNESQQDFLKRCGKSKSKDECSRLWKQGRKNMRITPIRENRSTDIDLDKIRRVAGNGDLSEADVFDFGVFVIARSGVNRNATDITAEGQRGAVAGWIGRPIYFRDHETEADNQIGRIYDAWTDDRSGETVTLGRGYGVKTDDLKDVFARISAGVHREMSCGYEPVRSVCSACDSDLDSQTFSTCPKGHRVGSDGVFAKDIEFQPDHISFVGRPAVEGAGLVLASADHARLSRLAQDGETFREWASSEFRRWYQRSNPTATADESETLSEKLSAREMVALARIERARFAEALPDGRQVTIATPDPEAESVTTAPTFKSFNDVFRKGK